MLSFEEQHLLHIMDRPFNTIYLVYFFLALHIPLLHAQENDHWFLGHHARVNFSGGSASASTGALETLEGTAAISDQGGNLLFYTEGSTIWDRNDNVMPNGSGLLGGASSTQAALIVPKPGACGVYCVFTTQDHSQNGDFRYSVVDMCLNNGYGDVVPDQKNVLIHTPCAEKLTAIPHSNGQSYWIVTHVLGGNSFLAYSLTSTGLDPIPVTSAVGSVHAANCMIGPLKASHDGTKLVCAKTFCINTEMFDFDASTGVVSNAVDLSTLYSLPNGVYGLEFSPNDQLLYVSVTWAVNRLYQIDLTTQQAEQIATGPGGGYYFGALQLAPDGRIYMARKDEAFLDVVEHPDVPGTGCSYATPGFDLVPGTTSDIGMPCMIPATILTSGAEQILFDLGADTSFCSGSIILTPPADCNSSFLWQDGSTSNTYVVQTPGSYWIQVSNSCGIGSDTIHVSGTGQGSLDIGPDTAFCAGGNLVIGIPNGADSLIWSNGSTAEQITVDQPGIYSVQYFTDGCSFQDSILVNVLPSPTAGFTWTQHPCDLTISFQSSALGATGLLWDLGNGSSSSDTDPVADYPGQGGYSVELVAMNACGIDSVEQFITVAAPGTLIISGPSFICGDEPIQFGAVLSNAALSSILWSTGDTSYTITLDLTEDQVLNAIVQDSDGCIYNASLAVTVLGSGVASVTYIPNVFTPNGDGLNDVFAPVLSDADAFKEMRIFNRWGQEVDASSKLLRPWDGRYRNEPVPDGTYVYIIRWEDRCQGGLQEERGHVTLLR